MARYAWRTDRHGNTRFGPVPAEPAAAPVVSETEPPAASARMRRDELVALATERGLAVAEGATKAEILASLGAE